MNDDTKILNRATNKYVKKDGKIGKTIIEETNKIQNTINFLHLNTHNISGPVSLKSVYIKELDMLINIFGDIHRSNSNMCNNPPIKDVKIADFIKIYLECNKYNMISPIYPIDVFIESDYQFYGRENMELFSEWAIERTDIDFPLENIIRTLKKCGYYASKKDCEYKPNEARVHFSDIRKLVKIPFKGKKMEPLEIKFQQYLLKVGIEKYINDMYNIYKMLFKHPKILKQFNNIDNKVLADYIYVECERNLLADKDILIQMYKHINIEDMKNNDAYINISRNIRIHLSTSLYDFYTILRMFRIFDDGSKCKRIILYNGNEHSKNIFKIIYNCKLFTKEIIQNVGLKDNMKYEYETVNRCLMNVKSLF